MEQRGWPDTQRQRRTGADWRGSNDLQRQRGIFAVGAAHAEFTPVPTPLPAPRQPAVCQL
ncbi:hypothetical protein D3C71_1505410 [compost metagenome]